MNHTCFVPNCISGYARCKEKVSMFGAPKDEKLRKLWSLAIPRKDKQLTARDVVCAKHFIESDIIKEWKSGNIVIPYKKPKLAVTAVPSIFPDCPSYLSKKPPKKRRNITKYEVQAKQGKFNLVCADTPAEKEIEENEINFPSTSMVVSVNTTENLFNEIWNKKVNISLPNSEWAIHFTEKMNKRHLLISENTVDDNGIPSFLRQVVINENFEVAYFLGNTKISKKILNEELTSNIEIRTMEDINTILNNYNSAIICKGGPSLLSYPKEKILPNKCATVGDYNLWRHVRCPLIFKNSQQLSCIFCTNLFFNFAKKLTRNASLTYSTPSTLEKIRKAKHNKQKTLLRLKGKNIKLVNDLQLTKDKFKKLSEEHISDVIKDSNLPPAQVMLLNECVRLSKVKSKHGRRYTNDWLLQCMLLYIRSTTSYKFLLENEILPLCSISTIRKYLHGINLKCGIDPHFFTALKKKLSSKTEFERHGILVFDEIQVRSSINVDCDLMKINGIVDLENCPRSRNSGGRALVDHALVFMFSALGDKYAQPVAVYGVKGAMPGTVLAKLIIAVIIELTKAGAIVNGIICDGATTNRKMWTEFGISGEYGNVRNYFSHPLYDNQKIYVFSDAPHLIKCVRNRMESNSHLRVPEGYISWKYYRYLYETDINQGSAHLRVCHKISENHIKPSNMLKMKVKLATQIFSNSVAEGLIFYKDKKSNLFDNVEPTIEFTKRINKLFDALNRKYPAEGVKLNGTDLQVLEENYEWLNSWEDLLIKGQINDSEFLTKSTAQGLRVTIKSTLELTKHLLEDCNFKYVLTGKMSQDVLEKFFGIIRQAGCQNDHPTYATFLQLYKLLSIYKLIKPPAFGNCSVLSNEEKPCLTIEDIKCIWTENKTSMKEHVERLKVKLDGLITNENWEADNLFNEHDYSAPEVIDCIVYYVTGFLCRKLRKRTSCPNCLSAFSENVIHSNEAVAELTNLKTRGYLIHPNMHIFKLIQETELNFAKNIISFKEDSSIDVYDETINNMIESYNFKFPCKNHMYDILAYSLHYYVLLRMRQYCKQENQRVLKKSRERKKFSRLQST